MDKVEKLLREHIRKKISGIRLAEERSEQKLREAIRRILKEGDVSDIHPHRSTAINVLEDVLKKMVPTLRTDYKRLTTDKSQRESFRAHMLKAIKDALAPSLVNWQYLSGQEGADGLLREPAPENVKQAASDEDDLDAELAALEEADIQVDIEDDNDPDETKKVPVESDDEPSPEEEFGSGLEGMDETGRNMAYTSHRKVSQYILDAYDTLANATDKEVFVDYLLTNVKLYFDKFEGELQSSVAEPESPEYEENKTT